ncbi:C40 family peptidase [Hamadaea tsunoensis]|uniref:C40 family peptidase n=1 Tax=Hamadaea tsunoensis TaxID=53368 RepID=UPI0004898648|nr:C40 family peptidase [Hamadaea tsunoensis]
MNASVRVATATLFRQPTGDRPADEPALAAVTDVRRWVAGLDDKERMRPAVVTQALLGEHVVVEEERDGWSRVVVTGQPATDLDTRGYPGWLPTHQLAPSPAVSSSAASSSAASSSAASSSAASSPEGPDFVVAVTATTLRDAPDGDLVLPSVVLGTHLRPATGHPMAARRRSNAADGWSAVCVPGFDEPLWARTLDLSRTPSGPVRPRDVLKTATMMREVAYVWGGLSPFGIDCSGLVHLSFRRHGVTLPRDAYNQAAATQPLEFGEEKPGDLYFFARPGERVHHVGFVAAAPRGDRRVMLHACSAKGEVVIEELTGDRAATLVSTHRP